MPRPTPVRPPTLLAGGLAVVLPLVSCSVLAPTTAEAKPRACKAAPTHPISAVQGSGWSSPLEGDQVTVEGVVVGDFQAGGELRGFFVQARTGDRDPATSDGIFVHAPDARALRPGHEVVVTGVVDEYFGLTEITDVSSVVACGRERLPRPTLLGLPADDSDRERLEGMRVALHDVTATETYTLARYGELSVSTGGRLFQPTNDGGDDAAEQRRNEVRRIIVDDGSTVDNPDEVPFAEDRVIRLGDTLPRVVGALAYAHGAYRVHPTAEPRVLRTNPRPAVPEVGGDVEVASFNVLNYFTTLSGQTDTGDSPRGADSAEELARQQAKIVSAITRLDAAVVGLMEIENDRDDEALDALVAALNARAGEKRYAAVEEPDTDGGLFGPDAIKVAMIYQPAAVVTMGTAVTTQDDAFANARLPLAQRFRPTDGGQPFTVVVNHFKSKGCTGAEGANADQGDGQGCWNADRVEQAQALLDLLSGLDGEDFLIIGDLNSYGEEDPIDVLESAGYTDLVDTRLPESGQYSYVYFGQAGYLDHALASPGLADRVSDAALWHINADEAPFLDYNTEYTPEGYYRPGPYRSSDHDPVLVGLSTAP